MNSLANSMKIPQTTLNSYLSGGRKPSLDLIIRICANYHVSADWLLGLTDDRAGGSPAVANAEYQKKLSDLEAENISLKGEVRGLQFALESALKGAQPAQASASRSRPA